MCSRPRQNVKFIRHFHVVVVQRQQRHDAGAKLLFCQSKPIAFFPVLLAVAIIIAEAP